MELGRDPATGKRKRIKRAFQGNQREAKKEMTRLMHEFETGAYIETTQLNLKDYLERWVNDYAKINLRPKTYERYEDLIGQHITPALGRIELSKLRPMHLQQFYAHLLTNGRLNGRGGLAPATVRQCHRIIHRALEMAVKWQVLTQNAAKAVEAPRVQRPEITVLTEEQINILLDKARDTTYYCTLVVAIYTGMRRGEIYGLRWKDVDFKNLKVSVRQTAQYSKKQGIIFKDPKTATGRRSIAITPFVAKELKRHQVRQSEIKLYYGTHYENHDLVISQPNGRPAHPDSITSWLGKFTEKIGIPRIRFHDLRHTHASLLLKQGVHPKVVSERLGHAGIIITLDTYSHILPGLQEEAMKKFDDALKQNRDSKEYHTI